MIVTLREAEEILSFAPTTLSSYRSRRDNFPDPIGKQGQAYLYDLDAITRAVGRDIEPTFSSENATRNDDGTALVCLECGARRQGLGRHLSLHGLTRAEYIEKYNLPRTTSLDSRYARAASSRAVTPKQLSQLKTSPAMQAARARKAAEHTRVAHQRADVPELRAPGQAKGVAAMHAKKRRVMDERMQALGYTDLEDAIRATSTLTVTGAADRLGLGVNTVRRWRKIFS